MSVQLGHWRHWFVISFSRWKFYPYQLLWYQIFAKVTLRLFWLGFSRNYQIKILRYFSQNFGCNFGGIQWTKLDLTLVEVLIPYSLNFSRLVFSSLVEWIGKDSTLSLMCRTISTVFYGRHWYNLFVHPKWRENNESFLNSFKQISIYVQDACLAKTSQPRIPTVRNR